MTHRPRTSAHLFSVFKQWIVFLNYYLTVKLSSNFKKNSLATANEMKFIKLHFLISLQGEKVYFFLFESVL